MTRMQFQATVNPSPIVLLSMWQDSPQVEIKSRRKAKTARRLRWAKLRGY